MTDPSPNFGYAKVWYQGSCTELGKDKEVNDFTFVSEVAHWMAFANAAYGWQGQFAFSPVVGVRSATKGLLDTQSGNLHSLLVMCNIPASDVIVASWDSKQGNSHEKIFMPAYYLAVDRKTKSLVFTVRGTMSIYDVLTDVTAEYRYTFPPFFSDKF